jgi:hypothetical protein
MKSSGAFAGDDRPVIDETGWLGLLPQAGLQSCTADVIAARRLL